MGKWNIHLAFRWKISCRALNTYTFIRWTYWPAGHIVQFVELPKENVPSGHLLHSDDSPEEKNPEGQGIHSSFFVELLVPGGHRIHFLEPSFDIRTIWATWIFRSPFIPKLTCRVFNTFILIFRTSGSRRTFNTCIWSFPRICSLRTKCISYMSSFIIFSLWTYFTFFIF